MECDFKPYEVVWNIQKQMLCMVVNIEDCTEEMINEFHISQEERVPVVYFLSNGVE